MYKIKKHGFTLVEVIVTVAIISILSTIGFISYSTYLVSVRDTKRVSDLVIIYDGLQSVLSRGFDVPTPEKYVTINLNGSLLGYQGYVGGNILNRIGMQNGGKDPKDDSYYSYYLYKDGKSFELMAWLEDSFDNSKIATYEPSIFPKAYAGTPDYVNRFPKVHGKPLGILTDTMKTPINEVLSGTFDIATTTGIYISHYTDSSKVTGTGKVLVASIPAANCKQIRDAGNGNGDGIYKIDPTGTGGFDAWCDMTSDGGGWTLVLLGTDLDIQLYDGRGDLSWMTTNTIPFNSSTQSFKFSDDLINSIRAGGMYKIVAQSRISTATFYVPSTCVYDHTLGKNGDCEKVYRDIQLLTPAACSGYLAYKGIGCTGGRTPGADAVATNNSSSTNGGVCFTNKNSGSCTSYGNNVVLKLYVK